MKASRTGAEIVVKDYQMSASLSINMTNVRPKMQQLNFLTYTYKFLVLRGSLSALS